MIQAFLDYLSYERNRSQLTVEAYEADLRDFEQFFSQKDNTLTWQSVDEDMIRAWMEEMMDRRLKASSVRRRLSALRSFFRFAQSRELLQRNPTARIRSPKMERQLPQFLKEEELTRLFAEEIAPDDFTAVRNRAILLMFYSTGMREAELLHLSDEDIDFSEQQLKVTGKRNKQRIIPFGTELCQALLNYKNVRARKFPQQSARFFLSDKGLAMSVSQVYNIVKSELTKVTTMKKRSPHVLRHSFATDMLNHGASLEGVRKLLGHASLSTTQIYTHTTFEQLRDSYQKAHPREKKE